VLGLLLLAAWALGIWLARKRMPVVSFGLAWMAVVLLPVSNVLVPTGSLLAERLLYLPSVGFLLGAGAVVTRALGEGTSRNRVLTGIVVLLSLAGVARSAERHRIWRSEAIFSVRGVQDAPRSFRAQRAYGNLLFDLGLKDLALEAYGKAIELSAPTGHTWRVRNDLAARFRAGGESAAEAEQLRLSLEENPDQEDSRGYLVAALLALGRYDLAAQEADSAMARGGSPGVFQGLRALADSAASAGAPAGSVKIRVVTGAPGPQP
jgi:tetratricopeptide (TPR) repeat protein